LRLLSKEEHELSRVTGPPSDDAPRSKTPPNAPSTRPFIADGAAAFRNYESLGVREPSVSRLLLAAHHLAYLRIAETITDPLARLATGLPGSALAGRVLPAG